MILFKSHWQFHKKNRILRKPDLYFHQVKEELWYEVSCSVYCNPCSIFFPSKYAEIIILLQFFFLKQPQFFTRIFFQRVYPDLLGPLAKISQVCMWRLLRSDMWNNVAQIWDIIITYQIYNMIFLGVLLWMKIRI